MPDLTNPRIQKGEQSEDGQWYHIDADEGYMNARLTHDEVYKIHFYRVQDVYRRQGYGKELLQVAKEHAKIIGARAIASTNIISDESIGAMKAVFGSEQLISHIEPRNGVSLVALPSITLDYTIQNTDPPLRSGVQILPGFRQQSMSPVKRYFEQQEADVHRSTENFE